MWTIIKIDKKKFELFKQDLRRKLGSESKFYAPKIKISSIRSNRKVEKNLFLLGSYIFCYNEKFCQKNLIVQLNSVIGLKYVVNNFIFAQNEIRTFIDKCKSMENKEGFIKENLFNIYINKNYKFFRCSRWDNF